MDQSTPITHPVGMYPLTTSIPSTTPHLQDSNRAPAHFSLGEKIVWYAERRRLWREQNPELCEQRDAELAERNRQEAERNRPPTYSRPRYNPFAKGVGSSDDPWIIHNGFNRTCGEEMVIGISVDAVQARYGGTCVVQVWSGQNPIAKRFHGMFTIRANELLARGTRRTIRNPQTGREKEIIEYSAGKFTLRIPPDDVKKLPMSTLKAIAYKAATDLSDF